MPNQLPLNADLALSWYRSMLRVRGFEDKVRELFLKGLIGGSTHLCQGQEAVSVGAVSAMQPGDVLTNTYRGHGEAIALGMPLVSAFAEMVGRSAGGSRGLGGSMHLTDLSRGNIGANAIVGAGLPIALGAAVAFQMRREPRVALTFFGDGAANIGTFHEALNMASVWQAPVVFVISNNLYGEYSPLRTTTPTDDLASRAEPFGMPGVIVDGQDVRAVHASTVEAVERARAGGGPSLLEMKTYRYGGHSRTDPARYRPPGELDTWKARDPIDLFESELVAHGYVSADGAAALQTATAAEMDEAALAAIQSPYPTIEEAQAHVYSR